MADELNSATPIEELHRIVTEFDRRYPNAFDEEAVDYIVNSDKNTKSVIANFFFVTLCFLISYYFLNDTSNHAYENIIILSALAFITYKSWKSYSFWKKISTGRRALERCVQVAGIPEVDVRQLRQAHDLILSRREGRVKRKDGGSFGGQGGIGGCSSKTGCGGSSGCGGGGGGGGCGGGGGGG